MVSGTGLLYLVSGTGLLYSSGKLVRPSGKPLKSFRCAVVAVGQILLSQAHRRGVGVSGTGLLYPSGKLVRPSGKHLKPFRCVVVAVGQILLSQAHRGLLKYCFSCSG